ncbi:sigma-70 family RNA polymerase sigma factor [Paenibacillus ginsengarvi]|uniref:Sigma-70 family RNA polymerase sigma factor n=1 Tax=Paenibacillus ginsengarvi TaxID=400777 RepID=A0A3B0CRQ0_9BACL|nr:sigma-70 family RNA polymerase sigma factor [Paenibacillus ginsengarvi]RKN85796.1 sigma-70 family RNA polymerase sigma factor [Paenibacillus ginsengarvi]
MPLQPFPETEPERRETFEQLVRQYSAMAHAVAYGKLQDAYLAEDAVQEAFAEAYLHLGELQKPEAFPGWLKTIVVRRCSRLIRKKRHPATPLHEWTRQPSNEPDVADTVIRNELRRLLRDSVADLPPNMRIAVQLFYFHGYSLPDIASCVGTSVPALKKRLFDARRKLKGRLPVADFASVLHDLSEGGTAMLHIVNGDSVAEKLRGVVTGDILVWREVYPDGPVFVDAAEPVNRSARARYLEQTIGVPSEQFIRMSEEQEAKLANFREYGEIVLWFEHDLFDQTMLCQLLHYFSRQTLGRTHLSLLCIGEYPGIPLFRGLGQLTPDQLGTLHGTWQQMGAAELELGAAVWEAYCASTPLPLLELLQGDTSALPFVRDAFLLHLARFPSAGRGIGIVERLTLEKVAGGVHSPLTLFRQVGDELHGLGMGDLSYWHCLAKMSRGPHPLLHAEALTAFPSFSDPAPSFRDCTFALTEFGRRVLAGEEDWVVSAGIDEWYGGVHLSGHRIPWRWDEERQRFAGN